MRAEKVILSFIAILVGLVAAGVAFYLYQMTKSVPISNSKTAVVSISPTPPTQGNFLILDTPHDEEVTDKKTITISGKTKPDATIIVSTEDSDQVGKPTSDGSFSMTQAIPVGTTLLQVAAVFSNGEEKKTMQTITYSTEKF